MNVCRQRHYTSAGGPRCRAWLGKAFQPHAEAGMGDGHVQNPIWLYHPLIDKHCNLAKNSALAGQDGGYLSSEGWKACISSRTLTGEMIHPLSLMVQSAVSHLKDNFFQVSMAWTVLVLRAALSPEDWRGRTPVFSAYSLLSVMPKSIGVKNPNFFKGLDKRVGCL